MENKAPRGGRFLTYEQAHIASQYVSDVLLASAGVQSGLKTCAIICRTNERKAPRGGVGSDVCQVGTEVM